MTDQTTTPYPADVEPAATFGAPPQAPTPAPQAAPVNVPAPQAAPPRATVPDLLAELEADARRDLDDVVHVAVPDRPGWVLGLSRFITQHELRGWSKRAELKGKKSRRADGTMAAEVDPVRQGALMLVEKCEGIYRQTEDGHLTLVEDADGDALTLTSDAWLAIRPEHRNDTVGALRAWAGDGGVLAMAAALLDVAGYGDAAAVVEDPTSR